MARSAVFLEAIAQGLAPKVGLVVPLTARVQHHVATQGALGAQLGARNQGRGLSQCGGLGLYEF